MIRKVFKSFIIFSFIAYTIGVQFSPVIANAANKETLGCYEEKLAQAKQEAKNNLNAINKTESEINYSRNQIASSQYERFII